MHEIFRIQRSKLYKQLNFTLRLPNYKFRELNTLTLAYFAAKNMFIKT